MALALDTTHCCPVHFQDAHCPALPCTAPPCLLAHRRYVHQGLLYAQQDPRALQAHVECVEDTQSLRDQLPGAGLVAFVGDGSVLPR